LQQLRAIADLTNTIICHIELREVTLSSVAKIGLIYHLASPSFKRELQKHVLDTKWEDRLFSHCKNADMRNKHGVRIFMSVRGKMKESLVDIWKFEKSL